MLINNQTNLFQISPVKPERKEDGNIIIGFNRSLSFNNANFIFGTNIFSKDQNTITTQTYSTLRQIIIANLAETLRKDITEQVDIKTIEIKIFEYFKNIARTLHEKIEDEADLPRMIHHLKNQGILDEKSWETILDFFLVLDGLSLQDKIDHKDFELIKRFALIFERLGAQKINNESTTTSGYEPPTTIESVSWSSTFSFTVTYLVPDNTSVFISLNTS